MLTKKQFFVVLSIYILYMLIGAAIFYHIEGMEEEERRETERKERQEIEDLLNKHYVPTDEDTQEEIFEKLTTYCGRPMTNNMTLIDEPYKWDYYHSVWFVITVVSTIGYGNLSPTNMLSRIFLIFYAFIGIPINGFVMDAMGGYFGNTFESLYNRWKKSDHKYDFVRLGLITQIILYLIPGFMFFIFIPALIFMLFEGWEYDVSVYYAFVTLSTIGFGDYCAGDEQYDFSSTTFWIYKVFLLFWVIIGLGYLTMVINYISAAMASKKVKQLEHLISTHIKKTPLRIRDELRTLLNEATLMRVKPIYKHSIHDHNSRTSGRSQSCPDLRVFVNEEDTSMRRKRKRALSECPHGKAINRICSDTDLQLIDKEKTFASSEGVTEPNELLLRVVNALGSYEEDVGEKIEGYRVCDEIVGLDLFSDSQILVSEDNKLSSLPVNFERSNSEERVFSCNKIETNLTWYGQSAAQKLQELRERMKDNKNRRRTITEPVVQQQQPSLLTRIKNTFKSSNKDEKKNLDIESQEYIQKTPRGRWSIMVDEQDKYLRQTRGGRLSSYSNRDLDPILENTSVAEFIRALTEISCPEPLRKYEAINTSPKRKLGVASMTPPKISPTRTRRQAIQPRNRRSSLIPDVSSQTIRRFSLRPVSEDSLKTESECKGRKEGGTPLKFLFRQRGRTGSLSAQEEGKEESRCGVQSRYVGEEEAKGVDRTPVVRRYSLKSGSVCVTPSPVQKKDKDKDKDKEDHDKSL